MISQKMSLVETGQQMAPKQLDEDVLCAFCAKSANKTCGRCGEFYCSQECQLCDWRNHRFICIPLPQLLPLNASRSEQFSRRTSNRASLTSIGRIRKVVEQIVGAAPEDLDQSETIGLENIDVSVEDHVVQKVDKHIVTGVESSFAKELIVAAEKVPLQPSPVIATDNCNNIELEKKSRISRSKILETAESVVVNPGAVLLPPDSIVTIVNAKDHKTVYVRRKITRGELDEHKQLIQMAMDGSTAAERLSRRPAIGDIVLALSTTESVYGRARVEQIDGNAVLVHFLDFGCSETVGLNSMKTLPDALHRKPCHLNEISLGGVPTSAANPKKIVEYLMKLSFDQTLLTLKYADSKVNQSSPWHIQIDGELIDVATSASINQKAIELSVQAPLISVVSESFSPDSVDNLSTCGNVIELPHKGFSGENVTVLVLDNSLLKLGYISCIRVSDSNVFGENDERVNAYGTQAAKDPPFLPNELGMVCVVRSAEDHRWYRAQFMEQKEKDMCEVVYLDYGNMETVNVSEIREMDEKLRFPCITVSCYIDGITWMKRKLSKRLVDRLKLLLPSYEKVKFDAIDYSDEEKTAIGKMKSIVKKLQDEELI